MKVNFYPPSVQASGNFNFGEILEKKPIGFPQDGGLLKPFSNLFYWAHAWTPGKRSTIGLHPHQGFEICTFVLKGSINHYDTQICFSSALLMTDKISEWVKSDLNISISTRKFTNDYIY